MKDIAAIFDILQALYKHMLGSGGKEASRCPKEGCIFKDEGCAVECGPNEKKCCLDMALGGWIAVLLSQMFHTSHDFHEFPSRFEARV